MKLKDEKFRKVLTGFIRKQEILMEVIILTALIS